jgi:hypothetical protein
MMAMDSKPCSSEPFGVSPLNPLEDRLLTLQPHFDVGQIIEVNLELSIDGAGEGVGGGLLKDVAFAHQQAVVFIVQLAVLGRLCVGKDAINISISLLARSIAGS